MRVPVTSGRFKRDVRRQERRGKELSKLRAVLDLLIAEAPLPPALRDHPLRGNWSGFRDLHVEPDWLLLYKVDGNDLLLARTGTHADIFDE
jgi:mRNA interferase YafQ